MAMFCQHLLGSFQQYGMPLVRDQTAYLSDNRKSQVRPSWHRYGWSAFVSDPERGPAFGAHCSASTFGHYGVSGTLAWADPKRGVSLVLLTTKSVRYSRDGVLGPVSDLISQM
jgi:CubicO group peptidase (beta-lactamase class C family)